MTTFTPRLASAFSACGSEDMERHVIHRPVGIEPAAGEELQPHGIEEAVVHIVIADVDRLRCFPAG